MRFDIYKLTYLTLSNMSNPYVIDEIKQNKNRDCWNPIKT